MSATTDVRREPGVSDWSVWTTAARLIVTDPDVLPAARAYVDARLAQFDLAASRFRGDSEVSRLAALSDGGPVEISAVLADLVAVALDAAARTAGAVDPTLGADLVRLGYAGDLHDVPARRPFSVWRRATYRDVELSRNDDGRFWLRVPAGVLLDLGATAKARAADLCATEVAERFGGGVLLSLGGDLRAAGTAPPDGWSVLVQDGPDQPASRITLLGAQAVATSSTLHRVWRCGADRMHHLLDPQLRRPVPPVWRTVTAAASTCVEANTLTTAAMVLGLAGRDLVADSGVAARFVTVTGSVVCIGGWPS